MYHDERNEMLGLSSIPASVVEQPFTWTRVRIGPEPLVYLRGGGESCRLSGAAAAAMPDRRERYARPHVSFDGRQTANNPSALYRLFAVRSKAGRTMRRRRPVRPLDVTAAGGPVAGSICLRRSKG
ncbi:hypothetical protein EVAR_59870_1 [Eumeta japonica]|uniref:Uncharacterized protein n=1 Tax=Eumeta variegata TaxID=151549 RepID=A0A4C1XQ60_EUMVA|nr:hypothetical protein EVAR_59870_1 [Eumeta japonica]